jgi:hypothetical protein
MVEYVTSTFRRWARVLRGAAPVRPLRDTMATRKAIAVPASAAGTASWLRVLPIREQGTQRRDQRQWLI